MNRIGLIGLCQIDLPDRTVRLTDGGFIVWGGNTFSSSDATLGTIGAVAAMEEGIGNMVPALELTVLPPSTAAAADLAQPGWQKCRARFWIAEFDTATGAIVGAPDLVFNGFLDQARLTAGRDRRELAVSVISWLEQLFELNTGNSLNATWHKSVWPGETGHDNATGLGLSIAWGVEAPLRAGESFRVVRSPWDIRQVENV